MNDESLHLEAWVLVDLAEGGPVDAAHRQHVDGCAECQRELDELRQTIETLRASRVNNDGIDSGDTEPVPGMAHIDVDWERLTDSVYRRIGQTGASEGERRSWLRRRKLAAWLPIAAASLALLWGASNWWRPAGGPAEISDDSIAEFFLLPPVEQDSEFQFLVALSDSVTAREDEDSEQDDNVVASWFGTERTEWGAGVSTVEILDLEEREREDFIEALAAEFTNGFSKVPSPTDSIPLGSVGTPGRRGTGSS